MDAFFKFDGLRDNAVGCCDCGELAVGLDGGMEIVYRFRLVLNERAIPNLPFKSSRAVLTIWITCWGGFKNPDGSSGLLEDGPVLPVFSLEFDVIFFLHFMPSKKCDLKTI